MTQRDDGHDYRDSKNKAEAYERKQKYEAILNMVIGWLNSNIDEYDKDIKQIKQESLKLAWYMRGGLSYTEAMHLSIDERKIINEIIKENLETTKKTKMPFF